MWNSKKLNQISSFTSEIAEHKTPIPIIKFISFLGSKSVKYIPKKVPKTPEANPHQQIKKSNIKTGGLIIINL